LPIDTLKAIRTQHSEQGAEKVMSGGDVKACPRHSKKCPQEFEKPKRESSGRQD
jgi:hypothetical protein